ncbi:hypothetical protein GGR52DRAFT_569890 [Hypoxylon sp. FL1284]|nr:hypothetical protein GGR52DRAFT_569890 [Hypoxylon sp. FL1284]
MARSVEVKQQSISMPMTQTDRAQSQGRSISYSNAGFDSNGLKGCVACHELFGDEGQTAVTLAAVRNEVPKCVYCRAMVENLEPLPDWAIQYGSYIKASILGPGSVATAEVQRLGKLEEALTMAQSSGESENTADGGSGKKGDYGEIYDTNATPTHDVPENLMCPDILAKVQRWIDDCRKIHTPCNDKSAGSASDTTFPSRYLLIDPGSEPPATLCLTRHVLAAFVDDIPWAAIRFAVRLGCRAVWIDSLCIRQDPDGRRDWTVEAGTMEAYYEGANLVLAATRARTAGAAGRPRCPLQSPRP